MADTLDMMDRQLRQLVRLIDDLLDISRITRGKIELRREVCDVRSILNAAVESTRPLIEDAAVNLSVSLPRQEVAMNADAARLSQVFSNLLANAAKYNVRGGQIWLSAEHREGEAVVSVRDSGIGIPRDLLSHIFEMFTQVDASQRSQDGLGIGLSLVRALVRLHGGTVEADSDGPGRGSEFIVRLPSLNRREFETPMPSANGWKAGGSERVLVVDDNEDAVTTLSMMLRMMGYEVAAAHDGQEAIAVAEEFRPNAVLLDLGMPRVDGFEAARRIRDLPWGQEVKIAALTGWGQDEDRRRSKESNFDAHLVKPVDTEALAEFLASVDVKVAES